MKGIPGRQQVPALRLARVKIVHVVSSTILEEGFHLLLVDSRTPRSNCDGRRSDALSKEIVDGDVKVFLEPEQVLGAQDPPAFTVVGHRGGRHAEQVCQVLLRYAVLRDQFLQVGRYNLCQVLAVRCRRKFSGGSISAAGSGSPGDFGQILLTCSHILFPPFVYD